MTLYVAPVVEGHTEVKCLERILHRVWTELLTAPERLQVLAPTRGHRSSLVSAGHPDLAKKLDEALAKVPRPERRGATDRHLILLLIDAEQDDPTAVGPALLARAQAARSDADIACVLAEPQLENWFKAAAGSLAGISGLPSDLVTPAQPEVGRGDTWLTEQMKLVNRKVRYVKRSDSVTLARHMDLAECHANSRSFRKLVAELRQRLPEPPCTEPA